VSSNPPHEPLRTRSGLRLGRVLVLTRVVYWIFLFVALSDYTHLCCCAVHPTNYAQMSLLEWAAAPFLLITALFRVLPYVSHVLTCHVISDCSLV